MLAENYLYTINRDVEGLKVTLVHKCGTQHHWHEKRAAHYTYDMTKSVISFMESMSDECCDQYLNCCGQADEAKRRAKAAQKAAPVIPTVKLIKNPEQKLLKEQRAAEKAARRAEKLKSRGAQSPKETDDVAP